MKKKRYLIGLAVLVVVAIMGTIGGMAFAADLGSPISNTLALGGDSNAETTQMSLAWVSIDDGTFTGDAATATWYVGNSYTVNLTATNDSAGTITGVYGKLAGWDPDEFAITYAGMDMETNSLCGFWSGAEYYFGPADAGDTYAPGVTRSFVFEVTPLVPTTIAIDIELVNGITAEQDTR